MEKIVGLKELRKNVEKYAQRVRKGDTFIVMKKSRPLFKIAPVEEGHWEEVIDFTKMRRGGVDIEDLLSRL